MKGRLWGRSYGDEFRNGLKVDIKRLRRWRSSRRDTRFFVLGNSAVFVLETCLVTLGKAPHISSLGQGKARSGKHDYHRPLDILAFVLKNSGILVFRTVLASLGKACQQRP